MRKDIVPAGIVAPGIKEAWQAVGASFERFCLAAGIANLGEMMERDAVGLCGVRHARDGSRRASPGTRLNPPPSPRNVATR